MKEELYMIPVNDAFDTDCECPVCSMYKSIESDAVNFTLGPSYMEDDIRMVTDKTGFCSAHADMLYKHHTHLKNTIENLEKLSKSPVKAPSLFKKNTSPNKLIQFVENVNSSCYVCSRINGTFDRYIATIFHLYKTDSEFAGKMKRSKGFCSNHFILLYKSASDFLSGNSYQEFIELITKLYIENLKRVNDDVEWFTDKFDYRNADAPWKNSKDALIRAIQKTNSTFVE